MKTKELMIGDWVSVKSCPKPNFYKISKLDPNMESSVYPIHVERPAEGLSYTFLVEDDIEPIPLTEEILKKNGFELDEEASNDFGFECYAFPFGKGFYIEHHNEYMITDHQLMEFKYVHELQHVLRLCKIDKEIEL